MNAKDFIIPLNGLASGKHSFDGSIGQEFFNDFENKDIINASLNVSLLIEKSGASSVMVTCSVSGSIVVTCDRCLGELELPVDFSRRLTVKFSSEGTEAETGDDVMVLDRSDCDLDMSQFIYDYVMLCIPIRKVHPEGECDQAVMDILNAPYRETGEDNVSVSPFAALKGLFDKEK